MCVCVLNFFEKVEVKLKLYTEEYQIKSAHACWLSHMQWKYHPHQSKMLPEPQIPSFSRSALFLLPKGSLDLDFSHQRLVLSVLTICKWMYAGQEATVRTGHGTMDWFQIGKGICQDVYCHPAYLTYMQSTSYKMPGWMKHRLESRFLGEMSITSDMQMTPSLWQKAKRN